MGLWDSSDWTPHRCQSVSTLGPSAAWEDGSFCPILKYHEKWFAVDLDEQQNPELESDNGPIKSCLFWCGGEKCAPSQGIVLSRCPAYFQGIKTANCLCELYPHCMFDDDGLSHAAAGDESTVDRRPNSMVTSARAKRAILQNHKIRALMHVREALSVNLYAEFQAENKWEICQSFFVCIKEAWDQQWGAAAGLTS